MFIKNVRVLHYDKDDIRFMHNPISSIIDPGLCGLGSGLSLQPGQLPFRVFVTHLFVVYVIFIWPIPTVHFNIYTRFIGTVWI